MKGFWRAFVFLCMVGGLQKTLDAYGSWSQVGGQEDLTLQELIPARSHHAATYDVVMQQEHHPLMFTPSPLSTTLRLTSFLQGELYAAADDPEIREHVAQHMDTFSYRVLDLYALHFVVQENIKEQLVIFPEKQGYLCDEITLLRERTQMLLDNFLYLFSEYQSHYASTVKVTLARIIKKIDVMLAA